MQQLITLDRLLREGIVLPPGSQCRRHRKGLRDQRLHRMILNRDHAVPGHHHQLVDQRQSQTDRPRNGSCRDAFPVCHMLPLSPFKARMALYFILLTKLLIQLPDEPAVLLDHAIDDLMRITVL